MSPYDVDARKYHDVMKLYRDVRLIQIKTHEKKDPKRVIRKRAGDDWF